ncbi:MAG: hypothetical protein QOJ65_402 [Fimbriimonadaceae bacterium]|jgi:hypothetical protein|nr:hypothetical protein [Fimbriimonadaceae bacterium]
MNMRKTAAAVLPLLVASLAMGQQIKTMVNGEAVHFSDVQPMSVNGRVLVPVRGVFEQMGVNVDWNPATKQVYANGNGKEVILYVGKRVAQVDGRTVDLDVPARMYHGRTMVPLRFISESMGAQVNWDPNYRTVAINTGVLARSGVSTTTTTTTTGMRTQPLSTVVLRTNTVIPFRLNTSLSSNDATVGEQFTATLDPQEGTEYMGLPAGTVVEGHVETVRAKSSDAPGVLGLTFDRLRMPNGRMVPIDGALIGLDSKSVENRNGRLVAKQSAKKDTKYVGIGAGAGAIIAIATKGNILTTAIIGGALGYLYDQVKAKESHDVSLKPGAALGVALSRDVTVPLYS